MVLENIDVLTANNIIYQGFFNCFAGRICSVEYPAMSMAAFSGKVVVLFAIGCCLLGKGDLFIDKPFNLFFAVFYCKPDNIRIAETCPGINSVIDMSLD